MAPVKKGSRRERLILCSPFGSTTEVLSRLTPSWSVPLFVSLGGVAKSLATQKSWRVFNAGAGHRGACENRYLFERRRSGKESSVLRRPRIDQQI